MGNFWYIWVLPVVGGIIWWLVSRAMVKAPGQALASKTAKVQRENGGKIAGVPYSKKVAACGTPSAVSAMGDGTTLKQWQAASCHIALLFDGDDICIGVSSEISV